MDTEDIGTDELLESQAAGDRTKSKRNVLTIACSALVMLAAFCVIGSGLILYFDPFDLNLIARLNGQYDAAAEAVPEDAVMYFGLDLLQLRTEEIRQVFEAIAASNPNVAFSSPEDALGELDDDMASDLAFNFTEDILPWVGQFAGIGVTEFGLDPYGDFDSAELIFAASVRDRAAADAFAVKFREQLESDYGKPMTETEYEGTVIYEIRDIDGVAFTRYKGLFLIANSADGIRSAMDAKGGQSFMDTAFFKEISDQLPAGRIVSGYVTEALVAEMQDELPGTLSSVTGLNNGVGYQSGAFALSFTAQGLQLDAAARLNPDLDPALLQQLREGLAGGFTLDQRLPSDTLLYVGGTRIDLGWQTLRQQLEADNMAADFDESMDSFEEEFGFNPSVDLFPNLDGAFVLAVHPSNEGLFALQGIPLGAVLMFETSHPDALQPVLGALDKMILNEFGVEPVTVDVQGHSMHSVMMPFVGDMLAYGLLDELLMLSTAMSTVESMLDSSTSLAADAEYQSVWQAFPADIRPVLYVDVGGLLGSIREIMSPEEMDSFNSDVGNAVGWIEHIAMGNRFISEDTQLSTLIIFVSGMGEGQ